MTGADAKLPTALLERLIAAERWVLLTGAGLSADSGVPTFRDAQTGVWARYDPLELATPDAFRANPQRVWEWYEWRRQLIAKAEPNPGHDAIAELARLKSSLTLVTQNVDGLHERAGSRKVVEFHGNIHRNRCFACGAICEQTPDRAQAPPNCPRCDGLLRPDVVWFGEAIPAPALERSFAAAQTAEVFMSIGTSALVYPAAGLAELAARAGATIVEINPQRTPLSDHADFVLAGSAAQWLPAIVIAIGERVS